MFNKSSLYYSCYMLHKDRLQLTKGRPTSWWAHLNYFLFRVNLTTLDLQIRHLELHFKTVHEAARHNAVETASRPDKLPRPCLEEDISEADWVWFEEQWNRYKRSTGLKGQSIIDHLWTTASPALARRCYEAGNADNITETKLLERMKKLAIRAQNNLVNVVEFLSMTQDTEEPAAMFISRLRGQAKVCDFSVKCPSEACADSTISYADKMVAHQLVRGLEDLGTQEKVLANAANTNDDSNSQDLNLKASISH